MTELAASRSQAVLLALVPAVVVMAAGGFMTDQGPWFQSLEQPSWRPPGWLFGPAWTVILALAVVSFAVAWQRAGEKGAHQLLIGAFAANAVLNIFWNVLFFQMRRPDFALVEIAILFLSVAGLMVITGRYSRVSAMLLVPYALWVAFATMLNFEIVRLNGPFV